MSMSIPKMMKAEVIEQFGPPEDVMHTASIPVPEVGDDEVLIDVRAAGVGVWEPNLSKGELGAEAGLPRVLGSDGSGTIVAKGSKVTRFALGDSVYGSGFMNPKGGFFAEYTVLPADEIAKVPQGISLDRAGVLAIDGLTALAGLDNLDLERGDTLLIFGASGGVGHLAVSLAKRLGARVLAVASGADGVELARRVGADEAIDGRSPDVVERVRALAPKGVDAALILASLPSERAGELLGLVKEGGLVAHPNGVELGSRGGRGITVKAYDGHHGRSALERLNGLIAMGPFHVEVSRTYALEETPQALVDVTKHHLGKLAVTV